MAKDNRFFIVGAARSGTTSLCYYLAQHSRIFFPKIKEPRYFAYASERPMFKGPGDESSVNQGAIVDAGEYERLYGKAGKGQWKGDGSTVYLYWPGTAERIRDAYPDARFIAILRNPTERAFSMYQHKRKQGLEPLGFADALDAEAERINQGWSPAWHYQKMGFYGEQLERYYRIFPRERVHVLFFEQMKKDVNAVIGSICSFLDLPAEALADTKKVINKTGPTGVFQRLMGRSDRLSDADRMRLNELYRKDTDQLRGIAGFDCSLWDL